MKDIKRLIVIDANPLMYRSFHSPGTRNLKTSTGILSGGFYGFLRSFLTLKKRFKDSRFIFCFDCGRSWRNDFFTDYKSHGEDIKPNGFSIQLGHVEEFLTLIGVPVYKEKNLEADDLISVFTSKWVSRPGNYSAIIVSSDRDFFQLICEKVMVFDDKSKRFFGPAEVKVHIGVDCTDFLTYKCIIGDISDKIPGIKGYGPVRARNLCTNKNWDDLSKEDVEIYRRNKHLIKLPTDVADLQAPSSVRDWYYMELEFLIKTWLKGAPYKLFSMKDIMDATKLLTYYECKSYTLEDFINKE
jgi:DNA polymerase-1